MSGSSWWLTPCKEHLANYEDSDEMLQKAAFCQRLHCLLRQKHFQGHKYKISLGPFKGVMDHVTILYHTKRKNPSVYVALIGTSIVKVNWHINS